VRAGAQEALAAYDLGPDDLGLADGGADDVEPDQPTAGG